MLFDAYANWVKEDTQVNPKARLIHLLTHCFLKCCPTKSKAAAGGGSQHKGHGDTEATSTAVTQGIESQLKGIPVSSPPASFSKIFLITYFCWFPIFSKVPVLPRKTVRAVSKRVNWKTVPIGNTQLKKNKIL